MQDYHMPMANWQACQITAEERARHTRQSMQQRVGRAVGSVAVGGSSWSNSNSSSSSSASNHTPMNCKLCSSSYGSCKRRGMLGGSSSSSSRLRGQCPCKMLSSSRLIHRCAPSSLCNRNSSSSSSSMLCTHSNNKSSSSGSSRTINMYSFRSSQLTHIRPQPRQNSQGPLQPQLRTHRSHRTIANHTHSKTGILHTTSHSKVAMAQHAHHPTTTPHLIAASLHSQGTAPILTPSTHPPYLTLRTRTSTSSLTQPTSLPRTAATHAQLTPQLLAPHTALLFTPHIAFLSTCQAVPPHTRRMVPLHPPPPRILHQPPPPFTHPHAPHLPATPFHPPTSPLTPPQVLQHL